jgi:hypothetical protein
MSNSNPTKLIHFANINSLLPKKLQIRTALRSSPTTSILALCETKISPDHQHLPKFHHYDSHYTNVSSHSSGAALFINNNLPNRLLPDLAYCKAGCVASLGVVYIRPG